MKFIDIVFRELLRTNKLLVYLDDLLIATETNEDNLGIIRLVIIACNKNLLELWQDKYTGEYSLIQLILLL